MGFAVVALTAFLAILKGIILYSWSIASQHDGLD